MPLSDRLDYEDARLFVRLYCLLQHQLVRDIKAKLFTSNRERAWCRYSGLAVVSDDFVPGNLYDISCSAGFDFLAVPLASSSAPRIDAQTELCEHTSFARLDMMSLNGEKTGAGLLGLVSAWIDPDSESAAIRQASTAAFRAEVEWAKFIGLQAIALPPPHDTIRVAGYAQVSFKPLPSWI
jgi:hypothetical protein